MDNTISREQLIKKLHELRPEYKKLGMNLGKFSNDQLLIHYHKITNTSHGSVNLKQKEGVVPSGTSSDLLGFKGLK